MNVPGPDQLLERVRRLPAAEPLLARLPDRPTVALVGGAVRDLLRGGTPPDLDLVVEGDAEEVARRLGGKARFHGRFGTSTVRLDGFRYDIARSRRETYAHPGALPSVAPAGLDEDLLRRDFTVNALAIVLNGEHAGTMSSAPRAVDDLEAETLRVLHDRSFIDDPTRLMRLCRYASRLGFTIEPHTRELADDAVGDHVLETVSGSRVGAEVRLLAREPDPVKALASLRPLGLDTEIHPGFGIENLELGERALGLLPRSNDARPDRLALAVAVLCIPADRRAGVLDRLAFEAADRDTIVAAATGAGALAQALEGATRPSEIAAAVEGAPPEEVALAGALGATAQARYWLNDGRHVMLEIGGADLLAAGVPQGPAVGAALRAALYAKLDGRVSGRAQELEEALRSVTASG